MSYLKRASESKTLAITNAIGTTPEIDYRIFAGGLLWVPATATSTSVTFYVGTASGGTFDADIVDNAASALSAVTVAAAKYYQLPDVLFAAPWVKIVSNADDSGLSWILHLKS